MATRKPPGRQRRGVDVARRDNVPVAGLVGKWSGDRDEVTPPGPTDAVSLLLGVLKSLPPWERFPDDVEKWSPSQVRARLVPRPGYVLVEAHRSTECNGAQVHVEEWEIEVRSDRLEDAVREWERYAGRPRSRGLDVVRAIKAGERPDVVPRIRRNSIDERRRIVQGMRDGIEWLVPPAIDAVLGAGGDPSPLRELERDPELCVDTVAAAVAVLERCACPGREIAEAHEANPDDEVDLDESDLVTLRTLQKADGGRLVTEALDRAGSTKRARAKLRAVKWIDQGGSGKSKRGVWVLLPRGQRGIERHDAPRL